VEENFHYLALQYRWPPGSWDHLTIARAARIWDTVMKRNKAMREQGAVDEEDLEA